MVSQFCAYLRFRGFTTKTVDRRRSTLNQFARFLAPAGLGAATSATVEQFLALRQAPRTRHAYRSDLRVFYRWAVERQLVDTDPTKGVDSIKVPHTLPRPLDLSAVLPCLVNCHAPHRQMIALALFAGLRCFEIAQLRAEDVRLHLKPPMIVVRNGKGGKDRTVPAHPTLCELLEPVPTHGGPMFPGRSGECVRSASVSAAISAQFTRCGITGTPHQLRHTFGTELARASGGDMVLTAALMGHASANTTMGYVRLAHSAGADIVATMYAA
jgi:site-specific recombinase XerD